jgi:polyisoprenoid-binding protein YceI
MAPYLASALLAFTLFGSVSAVAATKPVVAEAPSGNYALDLSHSSIIWKVSHMGMSKYVGRFAKFDATLAFDAAKPENSKLSVTIDPTSIRTEYPDKEKHDFDAKLATGQDLFNSAAFPKITYVSKVISRTGPKTANVIGDLTFLGVTKPVTLQIIYNGSSKKHPYTGEALLGFSATGKFKRSEFGFTKYIPGVGDEVSLDIETEFPAAK